MSVVDVRWTRPARLGRVRLGASSDGGPRAGAPVKGNSRDNVYRSPALADARGGTTAQVKPRLVHSSSSTTLRTISLALARRQNLINPYGLKRVMYPTPVLGSMRLLILTTLFYTTTDFESFQMRMPRCAQAEVRKLASHLKPQ